MSIAQIAKPLDKPETGLMISLKWRLFNTICIYLHAIFSMIFYTTMKSMGYGLSEYTILAAADVCTSMDRLLTMARCVSKVRLCVYGKIVYLWLEFASMAKLCVYGNIGHL